MLLGGGLCGASAAAWTWTFDAKMKISEQTESLVLACGSCSLVDSAFGGADGAVANMKILTNEKYGSAFNTLCHIFIKRYICL